MTAAAPRLVFCVQAADKCAAELAAARQDARLARSEVADMSSTNQRLQAQVEQLCDAQRGLQEELRVARHAAADDTAREVHESEQQQQREAAFAWLEEEMARVADMQRDLAAETLSQRAAVDERVAAEEARQLLAFAEQERLHQQHVVRDQCFSLLQSRTTIT